MQPRSSRESCQRPRTGIPTDKAHPLEIRASLYDTKAPALSRSLARVSVVGAVIAIVVAGAGACTSEAEGLFSESTGTSEGVGAGGGGAGATNGTLAGSTSTATYGNSSSGADVGAGTGGAGTGGAGTGGVSAVCGDGACNGGETPDTCARDCPRMCGDGACNGGETPQTCPQDCSVPACAHTVCEAGEKLVLGCDPCVNTVCMSDPYCCDNDWDGQCVGEADNLCGAGCCGDGQCNGESCDSCPQDCGTCPPKPTCPHSVCTVAEPLSMSDCYDPCVSQTCAADPSCCQNSPPSWDGDCVALAKSTCGADPCITAVCAQDPTCCNDSWTQACVELAKTECNVKCDCPHSICQDAEKLPSMCNPCATALCSIDPYCCDNAWDGYCVTEVGTICGIICN